jgi:hypothetical protein
MVFPAVSTTVEDLFFKTVEKNEFQNKTGFVSTTVENDRFGDSVHLKH